MGKWTRIILFVLVVEWNIIFGGCTKADEDLSLSLQQKMTLDKVKYIFFKLKCTCNKIFSSVLEFSWNFGNVHAG